MNSTFLSLNQAAKEVGKSPSTISKYLNNGKLSYVSKDSNGYKIDPAELTRVFPSANSEQVFEKKIRKIANSNENTREYIELQAEVRVLSERLNSKTVESDLLAKTLEDALEQRDDWKKQAQTLLLQSPKTEEKGSEGQGAIILDDKTTPKQADKSPQEAPQKPKGFIAQLLGLK